MSKRRGFTRIGFIGLLVIAASIGLGQAALLWAQVETEAYLFTPLRTIGQPRPGGLRYEANGDRFAWVDPAGALVFVDAETLAVQHTLYPSGAYEGYSFSRDGRLFAVAIGVRIEIWETDTGTLVARFEPPGANRVQGPLQWTRDDELLVFDSIVPAPQELRRSENDTIILPWVWDVAAASGEREPVLVNRVEAYPFYNIRVSLVAGDNGVVIGGLDNRLYVYDTDTPTMELIADLPAQRLETDAILAWRSATDPYLYVQTQSGGGLMQIDTTTNAQQPIELGRDIRPYDLERFDDTPFPRAFTVIGDGTSSINALTARLLGSDYAAQNGYAPTALTLLDVLIPLTDDPLSSPAGRTALLTYNFNETYGVGAFDLLRPGDVGQIVLSPDNEKLAMRRLYGRGEIEIYDLETGALERLLTPAEPDPEARYSFAYTDDETLVIDFERFNARTGERLARTESYTQPFDRYLFDAENDLTTFGGTRLDPDDPTLVTWRAWDIETGNLLRENSFPLDLNGNILRRSEDQLRYLVNASTDGALNLRILDLSAGEAQSYPIPVRGDFQFNQVIPNAEWTRFLLTYSTNEGRSPIEVFTREGERLYFDAGNNLPAYAYDFAWQDDRTIRIRAYDGGIASAPITGVDYHPSGLPQCVVNTLQTTWQTLIPLWERVQLDFDGERLNALTENICVALTGEGSRNLNALEGTPVIEPNVTAIAALLTPTPGTYYQSGRTPAPIAIPGVPTCITRTYQREALLYAELWRTITADVTDSAQLEELETIICEGLLTSLGGLRPTPTVNPDTLAGATATPMEAAAETTGGDEVAFDVMILDVETGARTFADNIVAPPEPPMLDAIAVVSALFEEQYNIFPVDPVLSPDGNYLAARNNSGFITIYRLTTPYSQLAADESDAVLVRETQGRRSLGLAPTGTQPPQALGASLPTITPTMTLTAFPLPQAETTLPEWGEVEFICPARALALLENAADFTPPGKMLVSSLYDPNSQNVPLPFTLDLASGRVTADETVLPCGIDRDCNFSPDNAWIVIQRFTNDGALGEVIIARADGSDAVTLYTETDVRTINPSFSWTAPHQLNISFNGILPTLGASPVTLIRTYNPDTGVRSVEARATPVPTLGLLPFDVIARQPFGTLEVLAEYASAGARYLLRDRETGESTRFAQGSVDFAWQPAGNFLYYNQGDRNFIYDARTDQHTRIDFIPQGVWSPDGTLRADWVAQDYDHDIQMVIAGELPPRLQVWDSETGQMQTYCFPDSNLNNYDGTRLVWSPDNRYLAFIVALPIGGDQIPTPTPAISPEAPPPSPTPVSLEVQYAYQNPRTIVLDTETGVMTIVSTEAAELLRWIED